jgi:carboxylesterase type B
MFWIHGGFFLFGSGNTEYQTFERFVEQGVIVVTVNYRLGPLGFLCLGDPESDGNMGLRDQLMALRWVKDNIRHFGGDAMRITLFGQGSGAVSAHALLLSAGAAGLTAGVILQSGSLLQNSRYEAAAGEVIESSQKVAREFGCTNRTAAAVLTCLTQVPPDLLMRKSVTRRNSFEREDLVSSSSWAWLPVVDGKFSRQPLLAKSALETILAGEFPKVPVMSGMVEGEGGIFLAPLVDNMEDVAAAWDILGPSLLLQLAPGRANDEDRLLANTITRFYIGKAGSVERAELSDLRDMFTDATFTFPHMLTSQLVASAGVQTYCYILAQSTEVSIFQTVIVIIVIIFFR